ncbi:putative sugar ABC transporter permease protein [Microlunatus phosphovorus NM-1]|uniref:Putative sugar ABC transporter permease protein n=1 Tax=Microlunatus phosphovorus (strain ATCC 700054 / DSM 10555 / JCM 9379 / NBRC 101784 / NCIMB 13414 / VKM Ac-1990 / NM-1) TaxID=1032480 RepID=F5XE17_MICPN|nr:sugar ABC transporter permease [Microlunatus phosphovorus]BAK35190.1 putative sugar ABC transporter permease protein [Microlunatus phosphovorus NM-1]
MSSVTDTEAPLAPESRRSDKSAKRRRILGWRSFIWVVPGLLLIGVFVYYPLVQNIYLSFFQWSVFKPTPAFVGAANYIKAVGDPIFWRSIFNNTAYAVVSLVFQVVGALIIAALVEGFVRKRGGLLRAIYFIPSAISLTVAGLLFYFIYQPDSGLLNEFLRIVGLGNFAQAWLGQESTAIWAIIVMSQWQSFGYTTLLYSVAIQRIPKELYEAADLDGVGALGRIWHITTPLVREMSTLLIIVTMTGAFQVFNEVMVMTAGGPNNSSQVLGTRLYDAGFINNDFGYAAAIATVLFLITTMLAVVQLWISRRRRVEW